MLEIFRGIQTKNMAKKEKTTYGFTVSERLNNGFISRFFCTEYNSECYLELFFSVLGSVFLKVRNTEH